MKLYNTLTRKVEDFQPLHDKQVALYSCGPTVYDHIHIGNLSAFIAADTLRRVLEISGYKTKHVMNFTDVDDKTIQRSAQRHPDMSPEEALQTLTEAYEEIFLTDMRAIGNNVKAVTFVRATESIEAMRQLITKLYEQGFAYVTDDGVYFSIEKYRSAGKKYGQLLQLNKSNTSEARIDNDEYDKKSVHDFALWKTRKSEEPAWEFSLDGHMLLGRPGWHIECSAMSSVNLGQPFDIHTGGVDLVFPHHENEIAQSTATEDNPTYATYFVHNEHLLVDGKKMSKSLNNFFTLRDVEEKGYDPLAFRLMILQAHYRNQTNFTWENLEAAQNRLQAYRAMADQCWQPVSDGAVEAAYLEEIQKQITTAVQDDMNMPEALAILSSAETAVANGRITPETQDALGNFLEWLDNVFGLGLADRKDITYNQKHMLADRQAARDSKDWERSDEIRDQLSTVGIHVRDTTNGQIWTRI